MKKNTSHLEISRAQKSGVLKCRMARTWQAEFYAPRESPDPIPPLATCTTTSKTKKKHRILKIVICIKPQDDIVKGSKLTGKLHQHRDVDNNVCDNHRRSLAKQHQCPSNPRRWFRQFSHRGFWRFNFQFGFLLCVMCCLIPGF